VQLHREYKDKGFEIVSVNVRDSAEAVGEFFRKYGATHIGALNRTSDDVAKLYGVEGTPTNVVINKDGQITSKLVGFNKSKLVSALKRAGIGAE
jgi:thioredoxin-related protein